MCQSSKQGGNYLLFFHAPPNELGELVLVRHVVWCQQQNGTTPTTYFTSDPTLPLLGDGGRIGEERVAAFIEATFQREGAWQFN